MEEELGGGLIGVFLNMVDPLSMKRTRTADDAVHLITLGEQKLRDILVCCTGVSRAFRFRKLRFRWQRWRALAGSGAERVGI